MPTRNGHFLDKFFHPEHLAIVGASGNPASFNYIMLNNLVVRGFKGRVYPVNPRGGAMQGLPVYPDVKSIDGPVDLAVISVPYLRTLDVVKDCVAKGVKLVAITAGGFSEAGPEGRALQKALADLVRENDIRAVGPNALSPYNTAVNLAISFNPVPQMKQGELSLIFQSGLYEVRLTRLISDANLHLAKLIDLGNKMDVNEVDAFSYLADDPATRVIGIHLESIEGDGREFLRLIRKASAEKHVVVLKSGRTSAGARAAASHTGVIVQGSDLVFDGALRQAGAIRAANIEEFFEIAQALERFGPLRLNGDRIAISTFPGGEAVVTTDLCYLNGLSMAAPGEATRKKIAAISPPWEVPANPYDLGLCSQFHDFRTMIRTYAEAMAVDPGVDGLAMEVIELILYPELCMDLAPLIEARKPLAFWVPGLLAGRHDVLSILENHYIPVFTSANRAVRALAALRRSTRFKHRR